MTRFALLAVSLMFALALMGAHYGTEAVRALVTAGIGG